jgi:amino acid transporter
VGGTWFATMASSKPPNIDKAPPKTLGIVRVAATLFFLVSGGPYGIEEIAASMGYRGAIAALLVTPLVWSVPVALMAAELGSALPASGGSYVWVSRALSPFAGFMQAWGALLMSLFDMGIYPALFVAYLGRIFPVVAEHPIATGAAMVVVSLAVNLLGAKRLSSLSTVLTIAVLLPFAWLAWQSANFAKTAEIPVIPSAPAEHDFMTGIAIAMWNYMGWDNIGNVSSDVKNPARTFPRALGIALLGIAAIYVLPLLATRYAGLNPSAWSSGSFVEIGELLGGKWLRTAMAAGGAVFAFGMFSALMMTYGRLLAAVAEKGFAPQVLGRISNTGAPTWALCALCIIWSSTLGLAFDKLVTLDIMFYGVSLGLQLLSLVVLRAREPLLLRPFKIPFGLAGAVVVATLPMALVAVTIVRNLHEKIFGMPAPLFAALTLIAGAGVYVTRRKRPSMGGAEPPNHDPA